MLTALVALSLFSGPTTIDFDHPGAPVSRAVEAMGKAYGVEMTADPTMKRDFVILALRSETVERARELLAKALNATWTEKEGKWTIKRTPVQEREDEEREFNERVVGIRAYQKSIKVPPRVVGDVAEKYVKDLLIQLAEPEASMSNELGARSALSRTVVRLCKELDSEMIARLPIGQHRLFGGRASLTMSVMPKRALQIIQEGIADHNAVYSLITARAATISDSYHPLIGASVEDARVEVYPHETGFSLQLSIPSSNTAFDITAYDWSIEYESQVTPHSWPSVLDRKLEMSDLALEMNALKPPRLGPGSAGTPPSKELLEVFFDHENRDYLGLAPTEVVKQAADAEGKSYVVAVPDPAASLAIRLSRQTTWTIKGALETVYSPFLCRVIATDRDVVIFPLLPAQERQGRYSRERFARALRAFLGRSNRTIEPLADAMRGLSRAGVSRLLSRLSMLARVGRHSSFSDGQDLLLLYADLTQGQMDMAGSGGVVLEPLRLSPDANAALRAVTAGKVRDPIATFMRSPDTGMDAYEKEVRNGRLASQLTDRSQFLLRTDSKQTLYYVYSYEGRYSTPMASSPERIAVYSDPDTVREMRFRTYEEQSISLYALAGNEQIPIGSYYMPAIYEGDEFEPMDKMPSWVRERYAAEIKRIGDIPPRLAEQPFARSVRMH